MAHIEKIKLKSGTAYRIIYYVRGRRYSYYMPPNHSLTEVKLKLHDLESTRRPPEKHSVIRIVDFQQLYSDARQHEIQIYRNHLALTLLIRYLGPDFLIQEIDHRIIHAYRDWLLLQRQAACPDVDFAREQKLRRGINKELQNLRTAFRWAYKNEMISENFFDKVVFFKSSQPIPGTLTRFQEHAFYHSLPRTRIRLAFKFIKYTGVRRSELGCIRWRDLDLANGLIRLYKTKNREEELIPMHPILLRIMNYCRRKYSPDPAEIIFPYYPDSLTTMFRRALDKAGLGDVKSPVHILRHTLGIRIMETDLSDNGERMAQEILRHKTRSMTRHYTKIAKQNLREKFSHVKF